MKNVDIGITVGECQDENERKQRKTEIKDLWGSLVKKDYYTATDMIFHDSYSLIREALNCYSSCAYMATALLCRSVIESSIYNMAAAVSIEWDKSEKMIGQIRYSSRFRYIKDYKNALKEVMSKYPKLEQNSKKIKTIRDEGNFVAHYSSNVESKIRKGISNYKIRNVTPEPVGLWITPSIAHRLLVDTIEFLGDAMAVLAETSSIH